MGTFLEERWGTRNWLIIYWVGGLGGNLLSCVASPDKVKLLSPFVVVFVNSTDLAAVQLLLAGRIVICLV